MISLIIAITYLLCGIVCGLLCSFVFGRIYWWALLLVIFGWPVVIPVVLFLL